MRVGDALALLLRRWTAVLVGLLLTGAACAFVIRSVEPDHQASGQLYLLLPPEATGVRTPTNPFLNLQAGISTAGSLAAGHVSTKDVQRELAARGLDAEYAVVLAPDSGPLVVVTAKDKDPQVALDTRDAVMLAVAAELDRIQTEARVPRRQVITTQVTNTSERAEVLPGSRLRALAGAGGTGLLLTLLLAFGSDRIAQLRGRRTSRGVADGASGDGPDTEPGADGDGADGSGVRLARAEPGGPTAMAS